MNMLTGKIFLDAGRQMLIFLEFIYRNILWLLFTFPVMIKKKIHKRIVIYL